MIRPLGLAEEIRALEGADLETLRAEWRRRFGAPPKLRSVELLRGCLAWRIQAGAHGGLDAATRRRLRSSAEGRAVAIDVGARIRREWRGVLYEVDRVEGGYRWDGEVYASLSAAASAITGVKRNGPKFFGLKDDEG